MKTFRLNSGIMKALLFLGILLSVMGCSKNDNNDDPNDPDRTHKITDLEIIINNREYDETSSYYWVRYEVKNKKNVPYDGDNNGYDVRFKIKTTDGSEYQQEYYIDNISANGSTANTTQIIIPRGKTPNASTFVYEIFEQK